MCLGWTLPRSETAASRNIGIPIEASTVTLPRLFHGADTLSLNSRDLLLYVYRFIAVNVPFIYDDKKKSKRVVRPHEGMR